MGGTSRNGIGVKELARIKQGGWWLKKDEAMPMAKITASCFFQCHENVGSSSWSCSWRGLSHHCIIVSTADTTTPQVSSGMGSHLRVGRATCSMDNQADDATYSQEVGWGTC